MAKRRVEKTNLKKKRARKPRKLWTICGSVSRRWRKSESRFLGQPGRGIPRGKREKGVEEAYTGMVKRFKSRTFPSGMDRSSQAWRKNERGGGDRPSRKETLSAPPTRRHEAGRNFRRWVYFIKQRGKIQNLFDLRPGPGRVLRCPQTLFGNKATASVP